MADYIDTEDVALEPGPLASLWASLDPATQAAYIGFTTERIDALVNQIDEGGLSAQTGKVRTILCRSYTDAILLPNNPVTAVSAISIARPGMTIDIDFSVDTVVLNGRRSFRLRRRDGDPIPFREDDLVTVTYNCGLAVTPMGVKRAALLILSDYLFALALNPSGSTRPRQGQSMLDFGTTSLMDRNLWLATQLLDPYVVS